MSKCSGQTPQNDSSSQQPPKKKKKKQLAKSKLSFADDEEEDINAEDSAVGSRTASENRSQSQTPRESSPKVTSRRLVPNPHLSIPRPKLVTKSALETEAQTRDALRREFLALQETVKATEIIIPFVFYDGTNIPAGQVKVKKGDPVWLFLDRCRKVGAELGLAGAGGGGRGRKDHRREWARVGVDDLMLVRGGVIIPHVCTNSTLTAPPRPLDNDLMTNADRLDVALRILLFYRQPNS